MRKGKLKHLPRSIRAVLNLFSIVLIMLAFYTAIGGPVYTPKQLFRREEKSNLVGPARIVDTISLENFTGYDYDKLMIGESENGITLLCYDDYFINLKEYDFKYKYKVGDVTVLPVPIRNAEKYLAYYDVIEVPIIVFDNSPDAVRAELQIELNSVNAVEPFQKEYTLSANRTKDGYFLFSLSVSKPDRNYGTVKAVSRFMDICDAAVSKYNTGIEIPATVRLFDKEGKLIF